MTINTKTLTLILFFTVLINSIGLPMSASSTISFTPVHTLSANPNADIDGPLNVNSKIEIFDFSETFDERLGSQLPNSIPVENANFHFLDIVPKNPFIDCQLRPPILFV